VPEIPGFFCRVSNGIVRGPGVRTERAGADVASRMGRICARLLKKLFGGSRHATDDAGIGS